MEENKKIIEINQITKIFDEKVVLNKLSLNVTKGSFHALIGENGAGKTTLIKSILNLYSDVEGVIKINGHINKKKESRENIYYFPTHAKFPGFINLYNHLHGIYSLHENNSDTIKIKISEYLKRFNLWDVRKNNPNSLSSGQKKKVLLIMALIKKPKILILDEPTANLDPNTRREFYSILDGLQKNDGVTIFVSTHNLAEISPHATSASFIFDGKVFWNGEITKKMKLEDHYFALLNKLMEVKND